MTTADVLTVEIRHAQQCFDGVMARLRRRPQSMSLRRSAELAEELIGELRKAELEERRPPLPWEKGEQPGTSG